jgi:macrolide-specific efflux system membrane fusion protein
MLDRRFPEGQIIAKLEHEDLKAKVRLREALLAEAEAEMDRLRKDLDRDTSLAEKNTISTQRFDKTTAEYNVAKARVEKAKAELAITKTRTVLRHPHRSNRRHGGIRQHNAG